MAERGSAAKTQAGVGRRGHADQQGLEERGRETQFPREMLALEVSGERE